MLSVNGRNSECRGTRGNRGSVRLTQGGSQAKSCNDVCPKVVRKQSPALMFAQGWFANKVLRWCLPKGGSRTKFCVDVCPKVVRKRSPAMKFVQRWFANKVLRWCLTRTDRSVQRQILWQFGKLRRRNCKERTAKGELQRRESINNNRWE